MLFQLICYIGEDQFDFEELKAEMRDLYGDKSEEVAVRSIYPQRRKLLSFYNKVNSKNAIQG